jgi:hypothetical protein
MVAAAEETGVDDVERGGIESGGEETACGDFRVLG